MKVSANLLLIFTKIDERCQFEKAKETKEIRAEDQEVVKKKLTASLTKEIMNINVLDHKMCQDVY